MTARLRMALNAVSVRRGDQWVLRDISLRLKPGERWALIGGNGAGKTQLLKLLGTDVWPTPTADGTRIYRLGRRIVDLIAAKQRIVYIGAELQDKYARYQWNPSVGDLLATGLHHSDLLLRPVTSGELRRIARTLKLCGLTHLENHRLLTLSYGQKRLALLARALVQNPDWLLLDEFYNGLDDDHRRCVDGILDRARAAGQSWIAAAHRAVDVPRGTAGLIELHAGRLRRVVRLRAADLARLAASADEHRPTRAAPAIGTPVPAPAQGRPRDLKTSAGTAVIRAQAQAQAQAQTQNQTHTHTQKQTQKQPHTQTQTQTQALAQAPASHRARRGDWLLRVTGTDLYVEYRAVLCGVNWLLRRGEHWAIVGANGAGKSSFLRLLYGDLSPALGGSIERKGFPAGSPIAAWKRRVGYVSPELQTDHAVNVLIHDLVASGRHASIGLCEPPSAADKRHARRWLEFFALSAFATRRPHELSYGQLRRALFARALAGNPRILLLDEPLTGLDPLQRAAMKRLLERLMTQRRTLIMAVHHPEDLPRGMTHALRLRERRAEVVDVNEVVDADS